MARHSQAWRVPHVNRWNRADRSCQRVTPRTTRSRGDFALVVITAFTIACSDTASTADAGPTDSSSPADASDAATCAEGALADLDGQIAYECAHRQYRLDGGLLLNVWVSTGPECGGYLVLVEQDGLDTQTVYLYDPVTRKGMEEAMGSNGQGVCVASATGVAIDCFEIAYGPTPTGFVDACPSSDAGADAATD